MSIQDQPHYELPSAELAAWIEQQDVDQWWNVDGDPLLTGRLSFPCPGDELADELRRIKRPLLVLDRSQNPHAHGQVIDSSGLDALVGHLGDNVQIKGESPVWLRDRLLYLSWKGSPEEWLLIEDEETSESSRADSQAARESN